MVCDFDENEGALESPPATRRYCHMISRNLLTTFERTKQHPVLASVAIRELLLETERCDTFTNLSTVREAYTGYLVANGKPGIIGRLKVAECTDHDLRLSVAVSQHYNGWTQSQISSTTWK